MQLHFHHTQIRVLMILFPPLQLFYDHFCTLEHHPLTCTIERMCGPMLAGRFAALSALRSTARTATGTAARLAAWLTSSCTQTKTHTHNDNTRKKGK